MKSTKKSLAQQRLLGGYHSKVVTARTALILFGVIYLGFGLLPFFFTFNPLDINLPSFGLGAVFLLLGVLGKKTQPVFFLIGFIFSLLIFIFFLVSLNLIFIILSGLVGFKSYQGWQAAKEWQSIEPDRSAIEDVLDAGYENFK